MTDSSSQIPPVLRNRFAVDVVPLIVVLDDEQYREGVDITTQAFYTRLAAGTAVSTSAPSPGDFLVVYESAADRGAEAIVSVHIGSNTSATVAAASVAAKSSPVPVEIVDTGTASFAVACCVWAAGDAIAAGADATRAAQVARAAAGRVGNVFVMGGLEQARSGGRLDPAVRDGDATPVLALVDGAIVAIGAVETAPEAIDAMVDHLAAAARGVPQRVGVGDALAPDMAAELTRRLRGRAEVAEVVRYEVGPSVGAHTGPGTVGTCFVPT
ncbi:MAG: DegV family protein [Acidimicrobiia bacterium]